MSYLNAIRLHFSGSFQAAVSTVNNDPTHYDNANFKPEYQQRQTKTAANGWWNPRGDANWRLIGCKITSAWLPNGAVAQDDPILECILADSDRRVAAKLVDLDPHQQLVSEIWGLEVRIADGQGNTLMRAQFEPTGFMNIWDRWPTGSGDGMASAIYQSVLTDIEWGEISHSPFLVQLQAAAKDGLLSIKFNNDAYDANFKSPTFTMGRITGTIGPASAHEPRHLVNGRQFLTTALPTGHFFAPAGKLNFCCAVVDTEAGKIYLDLGNSLPTDTFGGPFSNLGTLSLACVTTDENGNATPQALGEVDYLAENWYSNTAGVVALPADRRLTEEELAMVAKNPLALLLSQGNNPEALAIMESPNGVYVRADRFVFRLNPDEEATLQVFATKYGQPYPKARVLLYLDPSLLGPPPPPVGVPTNVLHFSARKVTNAHGQLPVTVKATDPKNPRGYIDGQVYGIRIALEETVPPAVQYPFNPWELATFLVWDSFPQEKPSWYGGIQTIFQQYANLYPIMDRFLDLASYDSVCDNLYDLTQVFSMDVSNPNAMPVTRDLSAAKRTAILTWLTDLGPDGKPALGTPPEASPATATASVASGTGSAAAPPRGGKLAVMQGLRAAQMSRR